MILFTLAHATWEQKKFEQQIGTQTLKPFCDFVRNYQKNCVLIDKRWWWSQHSFYDPLAFIADSETMEHVHTHSTHILYIHKCCENNKFISNHWIKTPRHVLSPNEMIDCLTRNPNSWKKLLDFVEIGVRIIYFLTYNSVTSDPIHQIFDLRTCDEGNFCCCNWLYTIN